jgi:hypothetical protein
MTARLKIHVQDMRSEAKNHPDKEVQLDFKIFSPEAIFIN